MLGLALIFTASCSPLNKPISIASSWRQLAFTDSTYSEGGTFIVFGENTIQKRYAQDDEKLIQSFCATSLSQHGFTRVDKLPADYILMVMPKSIWVEGRMIHAVELALATAEKQSRVLWKARGSAMGRQSSMSSDKLYLEAAKKAMERFPN